MSSCIIKMKGQSGKSVEDLFCQLKRESWGELVLEDVKTIGDCKVALIVLEKYYMRTGSYANLTVHITDYNGQQTADIIGSAGGGGIFNISWGSNESFAYDAETVLAGNGFVTI